MLSSCINTSMKNIKLSQWAKQNNFTYTGAYNLFKRGMIPNAHQLPTGTILVEDGAPVNNKIKTVVYSRVSSSQQKENLNSQAKRVSQFCTANGWSIDEVIKDFGSGLNDTRQGIEKILKSNEPLRIVIEHKDRLTRFGFNYIDLHIRQNGGEIIVINNVEDGEEDIVQDFVSVITSMCARIYGKRRGKRKTEKIVSELLDENN